MKIFKLKVGSSKIYELNKNIFELQTKQKKPFYTFNNSNEEIQYAVCPACDNPIQIIGLYKKLKNTDKPYGRHCIHSVARLAEYNQQAYDFCPYSKKSFNVNPQSRKGKLTELEKNIYYLLRDQFDRVIYILRQVLDIYITNKSAKSMLETFVKGKGWLYSWGTLNNIPWILCHLSWAKTLLGQPIRKDSDVYKAIMNNCHEALFCTDERHKGYSILTNKPGEFVDISYCLIQHQREIIDDNLIETFELKISNSKNEAFFSKQIKVDEMYFLNLINKNNEHFRNKTLLDIAQNLMPDL